MPTVSTVIVAAPDPLTTTVNCAPVPLPDVVNPVLISYVPAVLRAFAAPIVPTVAILPPITAVSSPNTPVPGITVFAVRSKSNSYVDGLVNAIFLACVIAVVSFFRTVIDAVDS